VVGKIARLAPLKGHEFLLNAAPAIVRRVPDVRFLLVGDGTLRQEIERTVASLGLTDRFLFAGMVPRDRVPFYLAAMDVIVHTSLREGLARALPQALLAGRPAVAYDIDGAAEAIAEGDTGFLLAPGDVEGLAGRVITLLEDPGLRSAMAERGRAAARQRFSVETMVSAIEDLYRDLRRGR
jgi:glycosyltransferase involved in cell wall biosynthesis